MISSKISSGPVPIAQLAHTCEVVGARKDHPGVHHHRLHQHRGDLPRMSVERRGERREIVPRERDRGVQRLSELTRRRRASALATDRHENVVEPAVVVTLETDEAEATGGGSRHSQCRLHHLGARRAEADLVRPTEHRAQPFRGLDLQRVLGAEHDPCATGLLHRLEDRARGVAEERRTLAEQVVDVVVLVHVPEPGTLPANKEDGRPVEADVGMDTSRGSSTGPFGERFRSWSASHCSPTLRCPS